MVVEAHGAAILMPHVDDTIPCARRIHICGLGFIAGHEGPELRLVVCFCLLSWRFKLRHIVVRLHGIPTDAVHGLDGIVRSIRLLIHGAVVPHACTIIRMTCLQHAFFRMPHSAKRCTLGYRIAECRTYLILRKRISHAKARKRRGGIEAACAIAGSRLIPLAAVLCRDGRVRHGRALELRRTEHLHLGGFSVRTCRHSRYTTAGDLGAAQAVTLKLRHIIGCAAVGDFSGDRAGYVARPSRHRSDGFA